MVALTAGNSSSTRCSTIRGTLVEGECRLIFVTLELIPHTGCFVVWGAVYKCDDRVKHSR
jgi:hypothetical protein